MNNQASFLGKDYWDKRYENNQTGWNIGMPSLALVDFFDNIADKCTRILIPGCGNAYEAGYLLENGFTNVTVVDISPIPLKAFENKYCHYVGKELTVLCEDFFLMKGEFDLIIEQTFFCAIDPQLRKNYVHKMATLVSKKGKLAGLLFNRQFDSNPPFGGSKSVYESLFSAHFHQVEFVECNRSIEARKGTELFFECSNVKAS